MTNPTALYSYQGQEPQPLPEKIVLSDGRKRTDVSTFTDVEIQDAGFTGPYEVPQYNQEYQRVLWNSETLSFSLENISEEELWDRVRIERNRLLTESDWTMVSDAPGELNLQEWEKYRQRLRDLPSTFLNPKEVIWPESPDKTTHFDLEPVIEPRNRWRVQDLEQKVKQLEEKVFPPLPETSLDGSAIDSSAN